MRKLPIATIGLMALLSSSCGTVSQEIGTVEVKGTVQTSEQARVAPVAQAPAGTANANAPGSACYSVSGSVLPPVPGTATFDVAGFDANLGDLESVTVMARIDSTITGSVINDSDADFVFTVFTLPSTVGSISGPGGVSAQISPYEEVFSQTILPHTSAEIDTTELVATATQSVTDLALYQVPTVSFDAADAGSYGTNLPLTGTVDVATTFEMSASIEYCYTTTGSIGITKTVTADPGIDPGTFEFDVVCSDGFSQRVQLDGAGSMDVSGMSAGSTCEVTEVFSGTQAGRWVVSVGGVCEIENVTGINLGETVEFNNRIWAGAYDVCAASPI